MPIRVTERFISFNCFTAVGFTEISLTQVDLETILKEIKLLFAMFMP